MPRFLRGPNNTKLPNKLLAVLTINEAKNCNRRLAVNKDILKVVHQSAKCGQINTKQQLLTVQKPAAAHTAITTAARRVSHSSCCIKKVTCREYSMEHRHTGRGSYSSSADVLPALRADVRKTTCWLFLNTYYSVRVFPPLQLHSRQLHSCAYLSINSETVCKYQLDA